MTNEVQNTWGLDVLQSMLRIRLTEQEIAKRYPENKMRCPTHLSVGQEAVPAVLSKMLSNQDLVVSTHRGHAHYLAKNGDLNKMVAELYGKQTGCSSGKGGSMHLIDLSVGFVGTSAIVGNSIPIGVGLALQQRVSKSNNISIVYLGDGATEEGVFYESLNFAVTRGLKVIFVCENNLYSVYSSLKARQPQGRPIHKIAEAMGANAYSSDGNDIWALKETFTDALFQTKTSCVPSFVECATYRWLEHCGPHEDDHLNYRDSREVTFWKDKDPIQRAIDALGVDKRTIDKISSELRIEIDRAFNFAEKSPWPTEAEMMLGEFKQ